MSKARQTRRMARQLGMKALYGVPTVRRPRKFAQTRWVGEGGVTKCGDIIVGRSREIRDGKVITRSAQRRRCADCANSRYEEYRYGCGIVLEHHRRDDDYSDDYDDDDYDGPEPVCEFGSRIEEIRAARNAALG